LSHLRTHDQESENTILV